MPHHYASLGRSGPSDIEAAMVEAWAKFLDDLDALEPAKWTIIVAYLVVEVGSVSLYPTTYEEPGTSGGLSVKVLFEDWIAEFAEIHDIHYQECGSDLDAAPSAKTDARFERQYEALLKKMAKAVKDAMADPDLALRFAALKKRDRFAVYHVDQGETVHTANLVHLWGNRPPKAFPADTPRMLFVGLMNKASIYPDSCLKFRGDQVFEATFFGNEFNDKYVDILASVPNVTELCKNLKVLILQSTRIKPAGVDRLKALLPYAKIKIKP